MVTHARLAVAGSILQIDHQGKASSGAHVLKIVNTAVGTKDAAVEADSCDVATSVGSKGVNTISYAFSADRTATGVQPKFQLDLGRNGEVARPSGVEWVSKGVNHGPTLPQVSHKQPITGGQDPGWVGATVTDRASWNPDLVKSVLMRAESRAPNPDPIGGLVEGDKGGPIPTGLGPLEGGWATPTTEMFDVLTMWSPSVVSSGPLMNKSDRRFPDPFDGRFVGTASAMGSSGKAMEILYNPMLQSVRTDPGRPVFVVGQVWPSQGRDRVVHCFMAILVIPFRDGEQKSVTVDGALFLVIPVGMDLASGGRILIMSKSMGLRCLIISGSLLQILVNSLT